MLSVPEVTETVDVPDIDVLVTLSPVEGVGGEPGMVLSWFDEAVLWVLVVDGGSPLVEEVAPSDCEV